MRPKTSEREGHQLELGAVLLESFINMKDELVILGKVIDWKHKKRMTFFLIKNKCYFKLFFLNKL